MVRKKGAAAQSHVSVIQFKMKTLSLWVSESHHVNKIVSLRLEIVISCYSVSKSRLERCSFFVFQNIECIA